MKASFIRLACIFREIRRTLPFDFAFFILQFLGITQEYSQAVVWQRITSSRGHAPHQAPNYAFDNKQALADSADAQALACEHSIHFRLEAQLESASERFGFLCLFNKINKRYVQKVQLAVTEYFTYWRMRGHHRCLKNQCLDFTEKVVSFIEAISLGGTECLQIIFFNFKLHHTSSAI